MKLVLSDGKEKHGKEKHENSPKCPFIPFFTTNAFWPDLSKIFSRRMHISSDFDYFPHISDLFWVILGKFHSIFLILCDGKEKHENRLSITAHQWP